MKKNVLIIFGGKSVEHDISIITAMQTLENLNSFVYNPIPVYITKDNIWCIPNKANAVQTYVDFNIKNAKLVVLETGTNTLLKKTVLGYKKHINIDFVINCCHGTFGEDGKLNGLLDLCEIPYSNSGILCSALSMNKVFMKRIFQSNNIPMIDYFNLLSDEKALLQQKLSQSKLDFPLIVKPCNLGSSVGITLCYNFKDLEIATSIAFSFDNEIIIEKALTDFEEINLAILGDSSKQLVSKFSFPVKANEFLDFDDKYIRNNKKTVFTKLTLDKKQKALIKTIATNAFLAFDCSGVVRFDFLLDKTDNIIYLNELNTIPGSLAFHLFDDKLSFSEFIDKIIEIGNLKKEKERLLLRSYNSHALDSFCLKK